MYFPPNLTREEHKWAKNTFIGNHKYNPQRMYYSNNNQNEARLSTLSKGFLAAAFNQQKNKSKRAFSWSSVPGYRQWRSIYCFNCFFLKCAPEWQKQAKRRNIYEPKQAKRKKNRCFYCSFFSRCTNRRGIKCKFRRVLDNGRSSQHQKPRFATMQSPPVDRIPANIVIINFHRHVYSNFRMVLIICSKGKDQSNSWSPTP